MDRIFLDANVLFSAAHRPTAGLTELWSLRGAELVTSDYAVAEARRNLGDPSQLERLEGLLESMEVFAALTPAPELRTGFELREKDWPILGGAVGGRATHLITGDTRDFGRYFGEKVLGVLVLTPADYLRGARSVGQSSVAVRGAGRAPPT